MSRRSVLGLLLGVALAVLGVMRGAEASTLAPLTEEQMIDASTYIVEGTVTDVWTEVDDAGLVWTRSRVEVTHHYKGPDEPEVLLVDSLGGRLGERVLVMEGAPRWSVGEHVFLYLDTVDFGRRLTPVAMFQGKLTVRRAPGETRRHAMRWAQSLDKPYDHRFLPHPDPLRRLYLDDLVERVQTRLDSGWDGQPIPGISLEKLEEVNTLDRRLRR